jgi:hypothetical protein
LFYDIRKLLRFEVNNISYRSLHCTYHIDNYTVHIISITTLYISYRSLHCAYHIDHYSVHILSITTLYISYRSVHCTYHVDHYTVHVISITTLYMSYRSLHCTYHIDHYTVHIPRGGKFIIGGATTNRHKLISLESKQSNIYHCTVCITIISKFTNYYWPDDGRKDDRNMSPLTYNT